VARLWWGLLKNVPVASMSGLGSEKANLDSSKQGTSENNNGKRDACKLAEVTGRMSE